MYVLFSKVKACIPSNKYLLSTYIVKAMLEETLYNSKCV